MKAVLVLIASLFMMGAAAQGGPAAQNRGGGIFDGSGDVGGPKLRGSYRYDPASRVYTLSGSGTNMWGKTDEFFMAYKRVTGDFYISAKVAFEGKGLYDAHRKIGVIVREALTGESKYADVAIHGDGLSSLQYRDEVGAETKEVASPRKGFSYVTLERKGNQYIMKLGNEGFTPANAGEVTLDLGPTVYVGLFITSHNADVIETANFSDVQLEVAPPKPRKLTSFLEVLDVTTGKRTVVKEFPFMIEAPNWTPDGKWLVYNSGGKLYKINPDKPGEPEQINTDYAGRLNNDHVISADGKFIAISNSPVEGGGSRVYTVPFTGGVPRLITPLAPSYLHGISPDGKTLAYCAERNGNFDVYTIPAEGGAEVRLTKAEGLDDGPEYSPDGKSIWFNSVRTGTMQVWRMNVDGTQQTQITTDLTRHSWFPHVSPDGKQVIFIAYTKGDLQPGEHVGDKNVELRLIPAEGGEAKTVAKLYGGQGTINVNSWAPDSKRIAFVSFKNN
ncbi:hypothetical protein AGMMS49574_27260 [Bacteroidia bacterium]|nr:hypothetical protein AGMMS49574_27260 [Bacteroidia bacterium]